MVRRLDRGVFALGMIAFAASPSARASSVNGQQIIAIFGGAVTAGIIANDRAPGAVVN